MKKMKIYSEKEVYNATSEMERTRRNFWNKKAEQLCTQTKTAGQNKQTLMGIYNRCQLDITENRFNRRKSKEDDG